MELIGIDSKALKKLPDALLQGPDREDHGRAYSETLLELQIRPDQHEHFFTVNLRPFRNKHISLIAKGDPDSLQKLPEKCLTALGNWTWVNDSQWLLTEDDLAEDEEPLVYVQPKRRKEGDHDR